MSAPLASTPETRPQPLVEAANDVAATRGVILAGITWLVSAGLLTVTTGAFWTAVLGAVPAGLSLLSVGAGAAGVVKLARPRVTPISDPATYVGGKLVALVPAIPSKGPVEP